MKRLADSTPAILNVVSQSLARSLALGFDLAALEGTGTPPEPRGLKSVSGIQTVSMGTNGAIPTNLDPFADAIGLLETANARGGAQLSCTLEPGARF
jgi:HK97 family phage major capsid protein